MELRFLDGKGPKNLHDLKIKEQGLTSEALSRLLLKAMVNALSEVACYDGKIFLKNLGRRTRNSITQ